MNLALLGSKAVQEIQEICCNKPGIKLTIGLYSNGTEEYHLFENNGKIVPYENYRYEIGSITKTFTGYILGKAVIDGKVSLEDRIERFIQGLPTGRIYPTLRSLATHTSGYPGDTPEFEVRFAENTEDNKYNKIDYKEMLNIINTIDLEDKVYPAVYSNFGIGILGYCLAEVYHKPIEQLIEEYIVDLGLKNTGIVCEENIVNLISGYENTQNRGNLLWTKECIIGAAGFLYSTAEDLLKYAKMQFDTSNDITRLCHMKHAEFRRGEGLPIDIGLCWLLIPDLNIIWHNGETRCFSSLLCINKKNKAAVTILSNYSMTNEISNIGIKQLHQMS